MIAHTVQEIRINGKSARGSDYGINAAYWAKCGLLAHVVAIIEPFCNLFRSERLATIEATAEVATQ